MTKSGGKRWIDKTVVVIASGPSLVAEDCALIEKSGLPTIAVNSSWKMARFCDVLYAGDATWWKANHEEIDIDAERWSCSQLAKQFYNAKLHNARGPYNSGLRAIEFAIDQGAKTVLMLGFDCSIENGTHWHGDHAKTNKANNNPTHQRCKSWLLQFAMFSNRNKDKTILNCSRQTAIPYFKRMDLEKALQLYGEVKDGRWNRN